MFHFIPLMGDVTIVTDDNDNPYMLIPLNPASRINVYGPFSSATKDLVATIRRLSPLWGEKVKKILYFSDGYIIQIKNIFSPGYSGPTREERIVG